MSALGASLRRLREHSGLTQEELAERAGVSARTVSDTERGLRRRLYNDTAGRLATGLGLVGPARVAFMEVARGRGPGHPAVTDAPGIPHPLTPLLGRTADIRSLVADLQPGARRLVTVTGLGGVGKTRLAAEAARQVAASYSGRVHWIRLGQGTDPARLVDLVASALGATPSSVVAAVAGRPTLVVLDAFEHVFSAAGSLRDLLGAAPELQTLVTSRERLHLVGERELVVGPLPAEISATLFMERARDLSPGLTDDRSTVAEICRLVGRLPLPLELAAAHVRYLPLPLLRDRLRDGLTDAGQVVQEAVAWSTSSLTSREREVLTAAGMFEGGWGLDALQAVCPGQDVVEALGTLTDRNLIRLEPGTPLPRWRMLDVVREIATGLEPMSALRRRAFLGYYRRLLADLSSSLGHEASWYRVVALEEPNIRTALGWAEEDRDADALLAVATRMWLFWQARGGLAEGRRWLAAGLSLRPAAGPRLQAAGLWGLAWLAYHQADDDAAEEAGRRLASLAAEQADPAIRRNALTITGMVAIARDRPLEAVARLAEALELARDLGEPWILATSLLNLGLGQLAVGRPDQARAVLGEALRRYQAIGDERFHARCLGYLGLTSLLENDPGRAGALFGQSLGAFTDLGEPAGIAEGLAGMAAVAAATGRPAVAAALGGSAERVRDVVGARELPLERKATAPFLATAGRDLGSQAWAEAWRAGHALSAVDAVALATDSPVL